MSDARLTAARYSQELKGAGPAEVLDWALQLEGGKIATSKFGPRSAAFLHLLTQRAPGLPVVWVDTGYNTAATYRHVQALSRRLQLNLKIYSPATTRARLEALHGSPPVVDIEDSHFSRTVKLEPFRRALTELAPRVWLTGFRRDQTSYRQSLDLVTADPRGLLKVAPMFEMSEWEVRAYCRKHGLPVEEDYFDPTKPDPHLECGLHTVA